MFACGESRGNEAIPSYTHRKQSVQSSRSNTYMLIIASLDKRTGSSTDSFYYGKPDSLVIAAVALRHGLQVE